MVSSQAHRSGDTPAWTTGACNRGFVSADPERQREVATDDRHGRAKQRRPEPLRVDVRQVVAATKAPRRQGRRPPADDQEAAPPAGANPRGRR